MPACREKEAELGARASDKVNFLFAIKFMRSSRIDLSIVGCDLVREDHTAVGPYGSIIATLGRICDLSDDNSLRTNVSAWLNAAKAHKNPQDRHKAFCNNLRAFLMREDNEPKWRRFTAFHKSLPMGSNYDERIEVAKNAIQAPLTDAEAINTWVKALLLFLCMAFQRAGFVLHSELEFAPMIFVGGEAAVKRAIHVHVSNNGIVSVCS